VISGSPSSAKISVKIPVGGSSGTGSSSISVSSISFSSIWVSTTPKLRIFGGPLLNGELKLDRRDLSEFSVLDRRIGVLPTVRIFCTPIFLRIGMGKMSVSDLLDRTDWTAITSISLDIESSGSVLEAFAVFLLIDLASGIIVPSCSMRFRSFCLLRIAIRALTLSVESLSSLLLSLNHLMTTEFLDDPGVIPGVAFPAVVPADMLTPDVRDILLHTILLLSTVTPCSFDFALRAAIFVFEL